ncbi:MAG TPA: discoidin domain-containing protein [Verrucomicrobiae bacterium]|nr:discoidin domain-containing protein [Verrucomicrobiae bacterium]
MKLWNQTSLLVTACLLLFRIALAAGENLPLAGEWRFALDLRDVGVREAWFTRDLPDRIQLPGVLQAQGFGDLITTNTPWVLSLYDQLWWQRADYQADLRPGQVKVPFLAQPPRHYLGAAWYQRDVEISPDWNGRRVVLFLERAHWETRAWLDAQWLGTNNSLCVPHEFEAGVVGPGPGQIKPGRHRLTVRCDNRMLLNYRPDAHSVSDSLGSSWNGIVGRIELRSTPLVWLEEVQVFPDVKKGLALTTLQIGNRTGTSGHGDLSVSCVAGHLMRGQVPVAEHQIVTNLPLVWDATGGVARVNLALPERAGLWSEFSAKLQNFDLTLTTQDGARSTKHVAFGLRDFKAVGQNFTINGQETHLRGTHFGGDFPLTGYPPCDVASWLKIFRTCKDWGLNHVRFHSFCPPEAAFTAADEAGIYLQIEPGMWNEIGPGTPMEAMLYAETERILKAYGNHPSFVLMSASNEAKGHWKDALPKWVEHFRAEDPRHFYTPDTGWSLIDEPGPVTGADYLAVHRIGQNLLRGERGWFGRDYASATRGVTVPIVAHEVGQWCAYPDYRVISKFTGYLRPGNLEIFRDSMASQGLLDRDPDFAWASGRFQLACYKEEIEANLRTPGLAGFQLLDLHDYLGQGTALVGVLDPFWESKGYVNADEWRQFCSPVVLLARLKQRVFSTADTLEAGVTVANFSASRLTNAVDWQIRDAQGHTLRHGRLATPPLNVGRTSLAEPISVALAGLPAPVACQLVLGIASDVSPARLDHVNAWNFWVYPAGVTTDVPADVLLTHSWDAAEARLAQGGKVILQPALADLDWSSPPLDRVPVFWNRLMGPGWSRMLGLWCDTNHAALAEFPTAANCDWQWTELIKTRAMNLGRFPAALQPIVAAIDDWNRNWKLGLIYEGRVGPGRLLVCTFDLNAPNPVARQLRRSLLDYAHSDRFAPRVSIPAADLRDAWFDTRIMHKLGARATADGGDAAAAIDGDPNTFWLTGAPARGHRGQPHPHALTVQFPHPVAMNGLVLMNRQNDRDHQGDIRGYALAVSDDGQTWREIQEGELPSTWNPQTIRFVRTQTARWLKLTARSGYGTDPSAALAELAILYAGPRLPDNVAPVEYHRVRSTSTDIDEGGRP